MEHIREQLAQTAVWSKPVPLGRPTPASTHISVPLPPSGPPIPRRPPSEVPRPSTGATPSTPPRPATVPTHIPPTEHNHMDLPRPKAAVANSHSPHHRLPAPRISAKDWSVPELCEKYSNFEPVRRISALMGNDALRKELEAYDRDGVPLVVEDWHRHESWSHDIFNLEWLLRSSGDQTISVRNMHDREDRDMTLADFVSVSRGQPTHVVSGERERLYWKDADCPPPWRHWLLESGAVPPAILPKSPDDYLGYLPPSESVETLLCYMGIGDTYTAAHKDLCSSSGHNLMCFSENNGSSFWFLTASEDAALVAKHFHKKFGQELDWETHVTTLDELGGAPFKVYVVEQKVGDLVLVPPRSCHQVVNSGGLAMKISWSRMTLDNLESALHVELPIYRRVCRPEQYRVKTTVYRSMLHLTDALQGSLSAMRTSAEDSPTRAQKLKRIVQLFDEVLREEFAACHRKLAHVFQSGTSAGWRMTRKVANETDPNSPSSGASFTIQPPAVFQEQRDDNKAKRHAQSCNFACDFCGADIFQSFFECERCVAPHSDYEKTGDGLHICPGCYVEGRICECEKMQPIQCRPFADLVSDRNDAAKVVSDLLGPEDCLAEMVERCAVLIVPAPNY
ncbi:hypothetical protein C8Q77DRAFT_1051081 [Trametes polyzona]|nr:hypothetical protein C8Q77DRAFT_1051081 [Trametes polyzona]